MPPRNPKTSDTTPLAAAISIARARPAPTVGQHAAIPDANRARAGDERRPLATAAAASTWLSPEASSTAARNAASQPRETYSSHEWPL